MTHKNWLDGAREASRSGLSMVTTSYRSEPFIEQSIHDGVRCTQRAMDTAYRFSLLLIRCLSPTESCMGFGLHPVDYVASHAFIPSNAKPVLAGGIRGRVRLG
jgi:hypothetical protein